MKLKLVTLAVGAVMAAAPAMAELVFPSMSYRTGPFAAGGIPFADGYADYFTLLNERDGGIGGETISVPECETAYNTEKGVECYESLKALKPLVLQPLSTGITYQLIPKSAADDIPVHSMGYGRTSAKNGKVFSHVFNYPVNYWDGASVGVNYFKDQSGGSLEGKKITLLYFNGAYGKEPIPTLTKLAEVEGFKFNAIPIDYPGQEQKSQWLQIRRERPDYILFWGWGVMNQVAVQEAANIRSPWKTSWASGGLGLKTTWSPPVPVRMAIRPCNSTTWAAISRFLMTSTNMLLKQAKRQVLAIRLVRSCITVASMLPSWQPRPRKPHKPQPADRKSPLVKCAMQWKYLKSQRKKWLPRACQTLARSLR